RTLVIGRANLRDLDPPGGAVEQFHTQMRFQLLHQLRRGCSAYVQSFGGFCKTAGLYHAHKGLHCVEAVHGISLTETIVWVYQTMWCGMASLSARSAPLQCYVLLPNDVFNRWSCL